MGGAVLFGLDLGKWVYGVCKLMRGIHGIPKREYVIHYIIKKKKPTDKKNRFHGTKNDTDGSKIPLHKKAINKVLKENVMGQSEG